MHTHMHTRSRSQRCFLWLAMLILCCPEAQTFSVSFIMKEESSTSEELDVRKCYNKLYMSHFPFQSFWWHYGEQDGTQILSLAGHNPLINLKLIRLFPHFSCQQHFHQFWQLATANLKDNLTNAADTDRQKDLREYFSLWDMSVQKLSSSLWKLFVFCVCSLDVSTSPNPVVAEPLLLCRLPFLRSDGDFWIPPLTPMTPSPLSPPPPPPPTPTPNPLLETKPGLLESVEDEEEEDGEAVEEQVLAVEEVGRVREGAGSEGFTSVVKQGPNLFRQLPFFFFFTPSSPPPAAAAPPIPGPELEDWGRL